MQPTLSSSSSATFNHPFTRHPPFPPPPLRPPPPPRTQRSPRPPTLHLLRRTGEPPSTCSTYTLARLCQFLSCCRRCHCRRHRCEEEKEKERKGERETWHRRASAVGLGRKRDSGYGEGWPKPPLYLSRGTYTRASGTPTSNVVININGAAQYSPDLASPCVYLRSISLLRQAPSSPSHSPSSFPLAGRSHAASSPCYSFRVLG